MTDYIIIALILGIALLAQTIVHHRERKDLYNRIMSRDLGEFMSKDQPKTKLELRRNYFKRSMRHAYRAMYGNDKDE